MRDKYKIVGPIYDWLSAFYRRRHALPAFAMTAMFRLTRIL